MPGTKKDIKTLGGAAVAELAAEFGEPPYRAGQLLRWLYSRGARDFSAMTDLPSSFRERLAQEYTLSFPQVLRKQVSRSDGTRKYLLGLGDGVSIETVGMPGAGRLTVCFSTQAGCRLACLFCATGRGGFSRDLTPGEMLDQVTVVADDFARRVTNAVAMGQGEPFANYDALLAALRILNSADGAGIGARHLTVSTAGVVPGIRRFAAEPEQFTLAVSLHSAVQATRDKLMPGVRGWPLPELRLALAAYAETTGRRVTLEYALAEGVNDTPPDLDALVRFCEGLPCHINLIPMNPIEEAAFTRSSPEHVERFRRALAGAGVETSVRVERGGDIDAACGQLSQRHPC